MKTIDLKNEKNIKKYFNQFKNTSLFTWEGMSDDQENLQAIYDHLNLTDENILYIWSGKQMNDAYGLTGSNMYSDDLTFIGIDEYHNPMMKINVGARWFDDIVDNNELREEEQAPKKNDEEDEDYY